MRWIRSLLGSLASVAKAYRRSAKELRIEAIEELMRDLADERERLAVELATEDRRR